MYDEKVVALINCIKKEAEDPKNKMLHVQTRVIKVELDDMKRLAIEFSSIDTDNYRNRVKALADKYCESLELIGESRTTMIYLI